jgi:hypothetical protein
MNKFSGRHIESKPAVCQINASRFLYQKADVYV